MDRDKLIDKFDECFGFLFGKDEERKEFFDWIQSETGGEKIKNQDKLRNYPGAIKRK